MSYIELDNVAISINTHGHPPQGSELRLFRFVQQLSVLKLREVLDSIIIINIGRIASSKKTYGLVCLLEDFWVSR